MKRILPRILLLLLLAGLLPVTARAATDYTAALSEDVTVPVGETATVTVTIGSTTGKEAYHACDLELRYDQQLTLEEIASKNPDDLIQKSPGCIQIRGYGQAKNMEEPPVTLRFTAQKKGEYAVYLHNAAVDESDQAPSRNAPQAAITRRKLIITVTEARFPVTKTGEGILGEDYATQGQDYTFSLEKSQNYTDTVTVTVAGTTVQPLYDKATGLYTIPADLVTGDIQISRLGRSYTVTFVGKDITGEKTAVYGQDYSFKLDRKEGFLYTIEVTIAAKSYTAFTLSGDTYTIPGEDIKGNIKIKSTRTEDDTGKVNVQFIGSGSKDGKGQKKTPEGVEYPFQIRKRNGYTYSLSVWIGGKRVSFDYDSNLDMYYIPAETVTGDITIVVSRVATVEASEYLTLDECSLFLVVFHGKVNEEETAYYDGRRMYWSDRYSGYCWLVVSEKSEKVIKQEAENCIRVAAGTDLEAVDYSGDMDNNGKIQTNDAKLIRDMYNAHYTLESQEILTFLRADVATDRKLNVRDAAAVVARIDAE